MRMPGMCVLPVGVPAMRVLPVRVLMSTAISAGFRLERRLFDLYRQAQLSHHIVQYMIVPVTQTVRVDLQGHVTVAEMIGRS